MLYEKGYVSIFQKAFEMYLSDDAKESWEAVLSF